MNEDKLNSSSAVGVVTGNNNESSMHTPNVGNFISITSNDKPKDSDKSLNFDEFNIMTRTTVGVTNVENDNPDSRRVRKPVNYAAKKTAAQGLMDIALLTSNANQLKNLIEYHTMYSVTFYLVLFMIIISLLLQVGVGVSLIFKGRYDAKGKDKAAAARVNKWMMAAVFLITVINVFIAVFSPTPAPQSTVSSNAMNGR